MALSWMNIANRLTLFYAQASFKFPMIANKLKEIEAARAKLEALEAAHVAEQQKELAGLPAQYGFPTVNAFIKAVKAATGGGYAGKGSGKKRRTRAVITDATRAEVKKLTEAGKTGAQIAAAVGISIPSVQNIKKALGLVKERK